MTRTTAPKRDRIAEGLEPRAVQRAARDSGRDLRRLEFGDWQTPEPFAEQVLRATCAACEPATVLEPTCGEGAFLAAAARLFPRARLIGYEISETYVATARQRLPPHRTELHVADFFQTDWGRVCAELPGQLLVIGNPPWVTSAALGTMAGTNLPRKSSRRFTTGISALTGNSNFDISEWMLTRLLDALAGLPFTLTMLCKLSVARRVLEHLARTRQSLNGEVRAIDARRHFSAEVAAVVLKLGSAVGTAPTALCLPVYASLDAREATRSIGVVDGVVVSDVDGFVETRSLQRPTAASPDSAWQPQWRSGVKHDCSRVMELEFVDGAYRNGLGETVSLEPDYVFPLLKGSDLANGRLEPRRYLLLPQSRLGAETASLEQRAPLTWRYLQRHHALFAARKSRIYRAQPPFAVFGVGDYTFAPFKVAIGGLYKKLVFSILRPQQGRPVLVDDTSYFLPCASERAAEELAVALSSPRATAFFQARIFWDTKRPINKAVLESLSLTRLLEAEARLAPTVVPNVTAP